MGFLSSKGAHPGTPPHLPLVAPPGRQVSPPPPGPALPFGRDMAPALAPIRSSSSSRAQSRPQPGMPGHPARASLRIPPAPVPRASPAAAPPPPRPLPAPIGGLPPQGARPGSGAAPPPSTPARPLRWRARKCRRAARAAAAVRSPARSLGLHVARGLARWGGRGSSCEDKPLATLPWLQRTTWTASFLAQEC